MKIKEIKKEYYQKFNSLSCFGIESYKVAKGIDDIWNFIESTISQTRKEVRADTISQFVYGDIQAPQIDKFIKARMKAFLLIDKKEGIKLGRQEVIEEIKKDLDKLVPVQNNKEHNMALLRLLNGLNKK